MKNKKFLAIVFSEILLSAVVLGLVMTAVFMVGTPRSVAAESTTSTSASFNCVVITNNLYLGASDRFISGNNVARLQAFLIARGYLHTNATGFYGTQTFSAVKRFQKDNGILSIGLTGPLTRAHIRSVSCSPIVPPVSNAPTLSALSPTSGTVGTTVTVYGSGFDSNTTVSFGGGSAIGPNVQVLNSNTLTFRVPERLLPACGYGNIVCMIFGPAVEPGTYQIAVKNNNGTSNSLAFTVTSTTQPVTGAPVINGIDSPSVLSVNQTGTWTVRASDTTGGGLNYSVVWGDEYQRAQTTSSAQSSTNFVQSATFTHVYSQAGVYTPRFTVRGSNGLIAEVSASVQVSNQTQVPTITSISPSSGTYGAVVTVTGSGFTRYNNSINYAGRSAAVVGVESINGTTLQFKVPATPCSAGMYCAQVVMEPGTYPVSVTNQNGGTSNTMYFTLTSGNNQPIDQTINASVGSKVTVNPGVNTLEITPLRIVEDSRCPVGVYCIQAGRVVVETQVQVNNTVQVVNLAFGGSAYGGAELSTSLSGYTVSITNVYPQARQGGVASGEYVISYRVVR